MAGELVDERVTRTVRARAATAAKGAADLAVLLSYERTQPTQPLLEGLLGLRNSDGPPEIRATAGGFLRQAAPWAVDVQPVLEALLENAGNDRSRALFAAWASPRAPGSMQLLAEEHGISAQRVGRIVHRAAAQVRAAVATAPAPLPWLVSDLGRRLGRVASEPRVDAVLGRLGVEGPAGDVLLWLAGPYRPVPSRPGWLAVEAPEIVARTSSVLAADGGVRRLADVEAELELHPDQVGPWLRACQATVIHDLAVSLSGPLPAAIERVLDAHGRPLTASELTVCLGEKGRAVTERDLAGALRSRRFRRSAAGEVRLTDWSTESAAPKQAKRATPAKARSRPRSQPVPAGPARLEAVPESSGDGRLWLWVRVDTEVLRGAEAVVPRGLVDALGVQAPHRRTFSSRYGPLVLANDGPEPVRGSVRAVALAAGAHDGDTLLLGFAGEGGVTVEVRHATGHTVPAELTDTQTNPDNLAIGGTP